MNPNPVPPPDGDFSTYLDTDRRTGTPPNERPIHSSTTENLRVLRTFKAGSGIWTQPTAVDGSVLAGGQDGYEYDVNATSGALIWKTFLGIDNQDTRCASFNLGITSTPTITGGVVYVAGGNATFYALSEQTGKILWELATGNISSGCYDWGSPLIEDGYADLGVASRCDMPLVPGGLYRSP